MVEINNAAEQETANPGTEKASPLELLRTDLVGMTLVSGILIAAPGLSGIIGRIMKLFTPPIIGSVLILLCLQLSCSLLTILPWLY